jgi:hypothetical protein
MGWTTERVLALASDPGSAQAGSKLANPSSWVSLGRAGGAAWGECQGSGSTPYQAQIDLNGPVLRCNCPSHKRPCKHSIGLFLLLVAQPDLFPAQEPPGWVKQRQFQEAEKAPVKKPVDVEAQAKRAEQREAKVSAGLKELDLWLRDLVRGGLAAAASHPPTFWEAPVARMVDAQAPGLARRLRSMALLPQSGTGWPGRLLEQLGRLRLLIAGYERLDTLQPGTQADIRTLIGWTEREDDLIKLPGKRDRWLTVGQYVERMEEDNLRARRTWLIGWKSEQAAMLLEFAYGDQPFKTTLLPGLCFEADLVFYMSAYPLRALIKQSYGTAALPGTIPGACQTIAAAEAVYVAALARNPWLERFPAALSSVIPVRRDDRWAVRDSVGALWSLAPEYSEGWQLLSLSGGHPVTTFGEWDGYYFLPGSVWAEGRLVAI